MCGTRDHLDAFPQSIVNNSCTIFRRMAQAVCIVYACISYTPHAVIHYRLAIASRAVPCRAVPCTCKQQLLINARMNQCSIAS